jgi:hypothetical protein
MISWLPWIEAKTYFAIDDGVDDTALKDAIVELQVVGVRTRRAEVQVLVATSGLLEIEEAVVHDWECWILDLNAETIRYRVGQRRGRQGTSRSYGRSDDDARECLPSHLTDRFWGISNSSSLGIEALGKDGELISVARNPLISESLKCLLSPSRNRTEALPP